jgi:protein-tyrosine phosphatase
LSFVRTSKTHPLKIAEVQASLQHGRIGITFCPGKHDLNAATGAWQRDLDIDLDEIKKWGASLILTLVEKEELEQLPVTGLGDGVEARGMEWLHLSIRDASAPSASFEESWLTHGEHIRRLLRDGSHIVVHCKGGQGRAGMIAARLLAELGMAPDEAMRLVRSKREGAIQTRAQEDVVRRAKPIP